jgi:uncharacterized membrane protein YhaH (DUF805 family)
MQQLNPLQWAILPLKKYATFSGRAPRAEYWWYSLLGGFVGIGVALIDRFAFTPIYAGEGPLGILLLVALFVPGVAVTVRRLHDVGCSGWWYLLNVWSYAFLLSKFTGQLGSQMFESLPRGVGLLLVLVVLVCFGLFLVFMVTRGTEGANEYGSDPYGPSQLEDVFA